MITEKELKAARVLENTIISKEKAVENFGSEGQREHFTKYKRFNAKRVEEALIKTLEQLFYSVEKVKVGRAVHYELGSSKQFASERVRDSGKLKYNGKKKGEGKGVHTKPRQSTFDKYNQDVINSAVRNIEGFTKDSNLEDFEVWEPLVYPNIRKTYLISNLGRIKCTNKDYIFVGGRSKQGYPIISLYNDSNETTPYLIHRLVAHTFCDNFGEKEIVNHINGIKHDNYYRNLEWTTRQENLRHAWGTGLVGIERSLDAQEKQKYLNREVEREFIKHIKEIYPDDWEFHLKLFRGRKYLSHEEEEN